MIYQGIRLHCKNDQGYCDPTTRTQATIVWFHEDTCTSYHTHFKLQKYTQEGLKFIKNAFLNPSLMMK